jgi:hypothetical protein
VPLDLGPVRVSALVSSSLGCKCLPRIEVINSSKNYDKAQVTAVKCFIVKSSEVNLILFP